MELLPGEHVLYQGRPSWRAQISHFVRWVPLALVPFIVALILDLNGRGTGLPLWQWFLISAVLVFLVVVVDVIRRYATFYAVTNQRLRVRVGILSRSEQTTRFDRRFRGIADPQRLVHIVAQNSTFGEGRSSTGL